MAASPAPKPPTDRASGQQRRECHPVLLVSIRIFAGCTVLAMLGSMLYVGLMSTGDEAKQPRYQVALDAVAGLDPSAVLYRPTLDPEFNLTVGLASRSFTRGWCFYDGSAVRVSYRGVQLAGEVLPGLCARPRRSAEQGSVVAWGTGVRVPGLVRAALSRELRQGAAEFDVALTVAKTTQDGRWQVVMCKVKLGEAAASRPPCAVSSTESAQPAPSLKDVRPVSNGYSPAPENDGAD